MSSMFTSLGSFSSLSSLPQSSSQSSNVISRGLTKIAVDSLYLSRGEELTTLQGRTYDNLQAELGDQEFKTLCADPQLALVQIHYCQRALELSALKKLREDSATPPLSQQQVEGIKQLQMKGLINHDYLVLEIQPGAPNAEKFYIVAQKVGVDKVGIHITHVLQKDLPTVYHKGVHGRTIDCGKKKIPLKDILRILKAPDPHYHLGRSNCWDYGEATIKRLVMECAQVTGIDEDEKKRLLKEHDNLKANLTSQGIFDTGKRVMGWSTQASAR